MLNKVLCVIGLGWMLLVSSLVQGEVQAAGGRYYLSKEGVRMDKWYTTHYTVLVAAVNESMVCGCEVVIEQPSIRVWLGKVVDGMATVVFSWDRPVERVDGSPLYGVNIDGYVIEVYGVGVFEVESVLSWRTGLGVGEYEVDIRTVSDGGILGPKSEKIVVVVD